MSLCLTFRDVRGSFFIGLNGSRSNFNDLSMALRYETRRRLAFEVLWSSCNSQLYNRPPVTSGKDQLSSEATALLYTSPKTINSLWEEIDNC